MTGKNKKEQKKELMGRLGTPGKDKLGFVKWNLNQTQHGRNLKGVAESWAGEMLGRWVAGKFGA